MKFYYDCHSFFDVITNLDNFSSNNIVEPPVAYMHIWVNKIFTFLTYRWFSISDTRPLIPYYPIELIRIIKMNSIILRTTEFVFIVHNLSIFVYKWSVAPINLIGHRSAKVHWRALRLCRNIRIQLYCAIITIWRL